MDSKTMPQPQTVDIKIGFSDLVRQLLCLGGPDRKLDMLVHAMLGGSEFKPVIGKSDLRNQMWLADEIPAYTSDPLSVSVLAFKHGLQVTLDRDASGLSLVCVSDVELGVKKAVKTPTPTGAGLAAIIAVLRERALRSASSAAA